VSLANILAIFIVILLLYIPSVFSSSSSTMNTFVHPANIAFLNANSPTIDSTTDLPDWAWILIFTLMVLTVLAVVLMICRMEREDATQHLATVPATVEVQAVTAVAEAKNKK
jgi:hypothetical protein